MNCSSQREQEAAEAADRAGDHEGDRLDASRRNAEPGGDRRILPHCARRDAVPGDRDAVEDEDAEHEQQGEHAERQVERQAQPVHAAGQRRRVQHHDAGDEDEREAGERHPVAVEPEKDECDEIGEQRAGGGARGQHDHRIEAGVQHELRAEEAAERGEGDGREAQHAGGQHGIGAEREERVHDREADGALIGGPEIGECLHAVRPARKRRGRTARAGGAAGRPAATRR